ncbi:hypothetical protein D3C77_427340 [compost metagenome]
MTGQVQRQCLERLLTLAGQLVGLRQVGTFTDTFPFLQCLEPVPERLLDGTEALGIFLTQVLLPKIPLTDVLGQGFTVFGVTNGLCCIGKLCFANPGNRLELHRGGLPRQTQLTR